MKFPHDASTTNSATAPPTKAVNERPNSEHKRRETCSAVILVHELAHELLHQGEAAVRGSKTVRETEAEAVAFVVSQAIGLDTNTASSDYIHLYAGDKDTLVRSLDHIQQTASKILAGITDEPQSSDD